LLSGRRRWRFQLPAETARAGRRADRAGSNRLPWSKSLKQWRDRVTFLRKAEGDASRGPWPDLSDDALAVQREAWLVPALTDKTSLSQISPQDLSMR